MTLIHGDCIKELDELIDKNIKVDCVISDIPYGINFDDWDILHKNTNCALLGKSPSQENNKVFKTRGKPLNGWSKADKKISYEYYNWCKIWSDKLFDIMQYGSTCFIFAGRRLSHRCICAMEDSGFIFKDIIMWEKNSASYKAQRLSCVFDRRSDFENSEKFKGWKVGNLRPLCEPILWFMKPYPIGKTITDNMLNYGVGAFNENVLKTNSMLNEGLEICSNILKVKAEKNDRGLHPTQKPVKLIEILIKMVTMENHTVLDHFMGSATTGIACLNTNRNFIGIESNKEYFDIAKSRIENAR